MPEDCGKICARDGVDAHDLLVGVLDELGGVGSPLEGVKPLVEGG